MKKLIILSLLIFNTAMVRSQTSRAYICQNGDISFFSETPLENIDAVSTNLNCVLNIATNEINYLVNITSFKFKKPLMQEHFNEKYMESNKYPRASYKGKINETIDWSKDGTYNITSSGILNIHNVDKPYTEKGTLIIKDGTFTIEGSFNVMVADHNIEIPTLVVAKIAEVINVKHKCTLVQYVPKNK